MISESLYRFGLGFAASAFVARQLGAENYGIFSYVLSFVMFFSFLFKVGGEEPLVKSIIENPSERASLIASASLLKLIGGFIAIAVIGLSSIYVVELDKTTQYFIFIYSLFFLLKFSDSLESSFRADKKFALLSFGKMVIFTITTVLKFIGVYLKQSVDYFVYISCIELFLIFIFFISAHKYHYNSFGLFSKPIFSQVKKFLIISLPLTIVVFIVDGVIRIDQIMVKEFTSFATLGEYAVAAKLINLWTYIPLALINALYPEMVDKKKSPSIYNLISEYAGLSLAFSFSLSIGVYFLGDFVVNLVYGNAFKEASDFLFLYSITTFFSYLTILRYRYSFIRKKAWIEVILGLALMVLNITLNYFMIPQYGAKGAIWASIISYIIIHFAAILKWKYLRAFYFSYLKGILVLQNTVKKRIFRSR